MKKEYLCCPWCKKGKFYPKVNPRGVMTVVCEKCHNVVDTDWDQKKALKGKRIKYAS